MADKQSILKTLKETGVVAIIRAEKSDDLIDVAKALNEGGVRCVEITMTVPDAIGVIEKASRELEGEGIVIGVGTVIDVATAQAAIQAGAGYVVSPVLKQEIIAHCNKEDVPVMPGAMTPTEILAAWEYGADIVKVFPAGVGGPGFFKALKGPLPQIEIMPTGGVNIETTPAFIKAGACAVGVGGELASNSLIAARDFRTITANASLDEVNDLVQECKDLMDEDDIVGAKIGVTDNMIRIKSIADEVLDVV